MDDRYLIQDSRELKDFSTKTFSGYKKSEVINSVLKSIEEKKIENACFWATECIVSGYTVSLWNKLLIFAFKIIHINNPRLPSYLLRKHTIFYNQLRAIDYKKQNNILLVRNSQMIRNLFFDIITVLATSLKTKRYDKSVKIEDSDFNWIVIQSKIQSSMNILPDNILLFHDPDEFQIIINEIYTMCKNKEFGYDKCRFWTAWLMKWISLHKKKKKPLNISTRDIINIDPKYCSDISWLLWSVIFEEAKQRKEKEITDQINSLYLLYKHDYTSGKQTSRISYIYNAYGLLTHEIDFSLPIHQEYDITIQVQTNVNKMFFMKKEFQSVKESKREKKKTKKSNVEKEKISNKLDIFNEFDSLIMKS